MRPRPAVAVARAQVVQRGCVQPARQIAVHAAFKLPFHDLGVAGARRRMQRNASRGVGPVRPVRVGAVVQKQSDDLMASELDGRGQRPLAGR
jgi:hypothetical protein